MKFSSPEHLFTHFGSFIGVRHLRDWRLMEPTVVWSKAPDVRGVAYATDGIEIALVVGNGLFVGHLANFPEYKVINITLAKVALKRKDTARERASASLNALLANFDL